MDKIYKFADPQTPDEEIERYELVELRGDRAMYRFICDMNIKPLFVYLVADMVEE